MDTLEVGSSLPLKRVAPTAKEDVEQFVKKPKVETQLVEPKPKYKPIPLVDFVPWHSTNEEWLPEGVGWVLDDERSRNDAYQLLLVTHEDLGNRDYFEKVLNCEEQGLYLKFYVRISKEVKEGESWEDAIKRLVVGVKGDLSVVNKKMAIVEYLMNRSEEVKAKERRELYCHILDELLMNKDFAAVAAKIINDNLYPDHHDEIRKCTPKPFLMELKNCVQNDGMLINEAHQCIWKAWFEEWRPKYGTMAKYYMLKMLIADKLRILPKELQGLTEELNITLENVDCI